MTDQSDEKDAAAVPGVELPAIFTNYFHAYVGAEITRISFGERVSDPGDIHYRASFAMTNGSAKLLADLILGLLATAEARKSTTTEGV